MDLKDIEMFLVIARFGSLNKAAEALFLAQSTLTHRLKRFAGFDRWGLQEFIAFGDATMPFRQRIDRFLAERGVFANVIMELDSYYSIKKMVMQNLGVSMLPERVVRDETKAGSLVTHDIAQGKLTRPTLIAYPKHKQTDKELLRFVNWVVETY